MWGFSLYFCKTLRGRSAHFNALEPVINGEISALQCANYSLVIELTVQPFAIAAGQIPNVRSATSASIVGGSRLKERG